MQGSISMRSCMRKNPGCPKAWRHGLEQAAQGTLDSPYSNIFVEKPISKAVASAVTQAEHTASDAAQKTAAAGD